MLGQTSRVTSSLINSDEKTGFTNPDENPHTTVLFQAVREHLCCELNGEAVILNLKNGKYYGLNPVGAEIWNLLKKPVRLSKIVKRLLSEFDVDEQECRLEVESFLTLMENEGLVEIINVPIDQIREAAGGRKDTIY